MSKSLFPDWRLLDASRQIFRAVGTGSFSVCDDRYACVWKVSRLFRTFSAPGLASVSLKLELNHD